MPPHLFWRYLPMHVLLNFGSILTYGVRGHAKPVLQAKRDAVLGLPAMVRARRSVLRAIEVRPSRLRSKPEQRPASPAPRDAALS